jgi:aspartate aminotransferase
LPQLQAMIAPQSGWSRTPLPRRRGLKGREAMKKHFRIEKDGLALDPIMAVDELYRADEAPDKLNLVVGVWQNEEGRTPVLCSVKKAEERLTRIEESKRYLPSGGDEEFIAKVEELVYGRMESRQAGGRIRSIQTLGATGALRLAASFVKERMPNAAVWVSTPAYSNHHPIFQSAQVATKSYRYYDTRMGTLDFTGLVEDLQKAKPGDVVLLHARCHNPTGADPDLVQWAFLVKYFADRQLIPLVDAAYLGFAKSIEDDSHPLRLIVKSGQEAIFAISLSKIFGLYSERAGILSFVGGNARDIEGCVATAKAYARVFYTSPPSHGAMIVSEILGDSDLREVWLGELEEMRERLLRIRRSFADALEAYQVDNSFFPSMRQNSGMFVLSALNGEIVSRLRERHIYMLNNGRLSLAGLKMADMDRLCSSILEASRGLAPRGMP